MKRSKYVKKILFVIVLLLCILLLFQITGHIKKEFTQNTFISRFQHNWGISLPENSELLFAETEPSFHGDGYRYYIMKLDSRDQEVQTFLSHFHASRNTNAEEYYQQAVTSLSIPEEQQLSLRYEYLWAFTEEDASKMLMLYDVSTQQLYLIGYCS